MLLFYIFWSFGIVEFSALIRQQSCAQPGARRREGCCVCHYLSWTDSVKPSPPFSNFGCCIPNHVCSLLEITTAAVVPCGGFKNSPRSSILCCYFYIFWSFGTVGFYTLIGQGNRVALNPGLGGVRDVVYVINSHEQTQSNRVCCFHSNFGCYISKGSLHSLFSNARQSIAGLSILLNTTYVAIIFFPFTLRIIKMTC